MKIKIVGAQHWPGTAGRGFSVQRSPGRWRAPVKQQLIRFRRARINWSGKTRRGERPAAENRWACAAVDGRPHTTRRTSDAGARGLGTRNETKRREKKLDRGSGTGWRVFPPSTFVRGPKTLVTRSPDSFVKNEKKKKKGRRTRKPDYDVSSTFLQFNRKLFLIHGINNPKSILPYIIWDRLALCIFSWKHIDRPINASWVEVKRFKTSVLVQFDHWHKNSNKKRPVIKNDKLLAEFSNVDVTFCMCVGEF